MYIIKAKIYKLQENNRFNDAKERILGKNAQNFEHRGHHVRRFLNILKLTIHLDGRYIKQANTSYDDFCGLRQHQEIPKS